MAPAKRRDRQRARPKGQGPVQPVDNPERLLFAALNGPRGFVTQGDANGLRACIKDARANGILKDNHLRTALQSACKSGNAIVAAVCLEEGAPTDLEGQRGSPALFWAVTKGHASCVALLLSDDFDTCPADVEWRDNSSKPIWFHAALNGHLDVLIQVLRKVRNLNAVDADGRSILHNLAHDTGIQSNLPSKPDVEIPRASGENSVEPAHPTSRVAPASLTDHNAETDGGGEHKKGKVRTIKPFRKILWDERIATVLLSVDINVNLRDKEENRNALHWAAATCNSSLKLKLAELLLKKHCLVNARSSRDKTALHLACSNKNAQPELVSLLLQYGADPLLRSDGSWTAMHNTVHDQLNPKPIIDILSKHPGLLTARTVKGMTPLHVAAERGMFDAVVHLLTFPHTQLTALDKFHLTPMLRAAQAGHENIARYLSPSHMLHYNRLPASAVQSCNEFKAHIVDFRPNSKFATTVQKCSVFEALYAEKDGRPNYTTDVRQVETSGQAKDKPKFRWIHLPANNPAWVEAIMAKAFLESGASDIEGFRAVLRAFSEQGVSAVHEAFSPQPEQAAFRSSFMRPHCQRNTRGNDALSADKDDESPERARPAPGILRDKFSKRTAAGATRFSTSPNRMRPSGLRDGANSDSPSHKSEQDGERTPTQAGSESPKIGSAASSTQGKRSRKESGPQLKSAPLGEELTPYNSISSLPPSRSQTFPLDDPARGIHGSVISFFMPYLHFDTWDAHEQMTRAVRRTVADKPAGHRRLLRGRSRSRARDELKRPSRSKDELLIDGYLHNELDLQLRRTLDQFYLRGIDTTIRDHDQVVGKWCVRQGKQEKLYMVDQLWMFVVGQSLVITAFPERWGQPEDDPLNVLEGLIQDCRILSKTPQAIKSCADLALLISGRCSGTFDRHVPGSEDYQFLEMFESSIGYYNVQHHIVYDEFYQSSSNADDHIYNRRANPGSNRVALSPDEFLSIGKETEILKQVRDIFEEVNILSLVLTYQIELLDKLGSVLLKDAEGSGRKGRGTAKQITEKINESKRIITRNLNDMRRMAESTNHIDENLIALLDLKQKQANALEARFSRDQGQVVLIFTIVSIFFLPSTFMAQFFSINVSEYQKDDNDKLPLKYVLRYVLGIGLGFTAFFVLLAFSLRPMISWIQSFDLPGRWQQQRAKWRIAREYRVPKRDRFPRGTVIGTSGKSNAVEWKTSLDSSRDWRLEGGSMRSPVRLSFADDVRGRRRARKADLEFAHLE